MVQYDNIIFRVTILKKKKQNYLHLFEYISFLKSLLQGSLSQR